METPRQVNGAIRAHIKRILHGADVNYYLDLPPYPDCPSDGTIRHELTIRWTELKEQTDD